jgi:hypothetical protein
LYLTPQKLSNIGVINSTGTVGLISANKRKFMKYYCRIFERVINLSTIISDRNGRHDLHDS